MRVPGGSEPRAQRPLTTAEGVASQRWRRVSSTITPLSASSAIRFGTAISPFATSANDQTALSVTTEPTITAATQSQRYGAIARGPNRYSAAFSP